MNRNSIVFFLLCLSFALSVTGATTYTWRAGEVGRGTELNQAFSTKMNAETPVVSSNATVAAGNTITIPVTNGLVLITPDGVASANTLVFSAGTAGQIIYIYNGDAQSTAGGLATITTGNLGAVMYASGGWKLISDE
jgi:hypothetical protein